MSLHRALVNKKGEASGIIVSYELPLYLKKNKRITSFRGSRSSNTGFSIIEIVIVLAIFGALMLMGLFFDATFYRGSSFGSDVDIFASVLQRARAKAINNVNESDHGVYIDTNNYVLFQGDDYTDPSRDISFDQNITRNPNFNFSITEIIFKSLSGDSNFEGDIIITGINKTATISLNGEGLINR